MYKSRLHRAVFEELETREVLSAVPWATLLPVTHAPSALVASSMTTFPTLTGAPFSGTTTSSHHGAGYQITVTFASETTKGGLTGTLELSDGTNVVDFNVNGSVSKKNKITLTAKVTTGSGISVTKLTITGTVKLVSGQPNLISGSYHAYAGRFGLVDSGKFQVTPAAM